MMAERKQPVKAASREGVADEMGRFPHLKPLSVYSRMVFFKAANSCSVSRPCSLDGPNWDLEGELRSSGASVGRKRRLDYSCLDGTCDTPLKRPCLDKCSSQDSACVLDSSGTSRQVKLVSSHSSSAVFDEIRRRDKTLPDQRSLGLDWIDSSGKTDGESSASVPDVHSSTPAILHSKGRADAVAFDCDVDEIMCLSPIDSADVSADGLEDFIKSCRTCYDERLPVEQGHSSWGTSGQKQRKAAYSFGKDTQAGSDEGYGTKLYLTPDPGASKDMVEGEVAKSDEIFMKSFKITVPNFSNNETPSVSIPIMSTPLAKFRRLVEPSPISSPNLDLDKESWNCEPIKASSTSSPSVYANLDAGNTEALPTIPFLNVDESKEGNVALAGTSLVCLNQEQHTPTRVKEEEDDDLLSVSQQRTDSAIQGVFGEETDASDSFESTLPLQVQVKSKVVLPNKQQKEAVKATSSEGRRNVFTDVPRPVVLYREEDWEKEKKVYVDLVTRHMMDNAGHGVMTELLYLMNSVANQGRESDGRKWQHPSDLTRRNYRLRNSSCLLSLDEWQNLNYRNHRRFAKVPQMFKRSPVL